MDLSDLAHRVADDVTEIRWLIRANPQRDIDRALVMMLCHLGAVGMAHSTGGRGRSPARIHA
jgi:hypothetical protein